MSDPLRYRDDGPQSRRRWLRVALIVVGLLVLLFVILKLAGLGGSGGHGPSRHFGVGDVVLVASFGS